VVACIQGDETVKGVPTVGTHLQPNVEDDPGPEAGSGGAGGSAKGMPALTQDWRRRGAGGHVCAPRFLPACSAPSPGWGPSPGGWRPPPP